MVISKLHIYTHKTKGGLYEVLSSCSRGAGTMRGTEMVVYRNIEGGQVYHRKPSDFEAQMRISDSEQPNN